MKRFDIPLVAEGLTAYAIERQNGWERHRPEGAPTWAERRCFWTDAILQGMTKLEGQDPDPKWLRQFNRRLTDAHSSSAAVPASLLLQKETIRNLRNFVFGQFCQILGVFATGEYASEHFRVQRFHAASENRRITCQFFHCAAGHSETFDECACASCRKDFYAEFMKFSHYWFDTGFVKNRNKGGVDFFCGGHPWNCIAIDVQKYKKIIYNPA